MQFNHNPTYLRPIVSRQAAAAVAVVGYVFCRGRDPPAGQQDCRAAMDLRARSGKRRVDAALHQVSKYMILYPFA